ncbi:MAG: MerR family DNA-binding transcriptional regulator [Cycloclasticus sp.]|nr:MerR family DNA-binding transcriptional regulator [Cycloclasticus sp.]MBQ0790298.1 MerR family DNA-binding transcriptional regulator [Cycloclasticus sp.]
MKDTLYTATELADVLGVSARTLRFYETKKLIDPRRVGNRRIYNYKDSARMKLILRGKRIGFSLDEIKQFLDLYDADPTQVEQLKLLQDGVNQRISQLNQQKKDISQTLSELKAIQLATSEALKQKTPN